MEKTQFVLNLLNQTYRTRFRDLAKDRLINEILPPEKDIEKIGSYLRENWPVRNAEEILTDYKELVAVFLVGCAFYHYNDGEGGFWNAVSEQMGITCTFHQRVILSNVFALTLQIYNLPLFAEEAKAGYHYVTPILCHCGIPTNCMPSLFEKLALTLEDRSFGFGCSTDNFLFLCHYGVNLPVIRYIRHLQTHGLSDQWLAECSEMLSALARKDTLEGLRRGTFSQVLKDAAEDWLRQHSQVEHTLRRGVQFESPVLRLDIEQMRLYVDIPQQKLRGAQNNLSWIVRCGIVTTRNQRAALMHSDEAWYTSCSVPLGDPQELSVQLQVELEGQVIERSWDLFRLEDTYIPFSRVGRQQRTTYLPAGLVYLLVREGTTLAGITYDEQYLSEHCSILVVNTQDAGEIKLLTPEKQEHILTIKAQLSLQGHFLFGLDVDCGVGKPLFDRAPELVLPQGSVISWRLECTNLHSEGFAAAISSDNNVFGLSGLLNQIGEYGCFRLVAISKQLGTHRFEFSVLPEISLPNLGLWYWPYSDGYRPYEIKFVVPDGALIISDDAPISKVPVDVEATEYQGKVSYKGNAYPFSLKLHPYNFSFKDDDGNILGERNQTSRFTLRDLCRTPNITFNIIRGDSGAGVRGRLALIVDDEERQSVPFHLLNQCDLPIQVFLDSMRGQHSDQASLTLIVEDHIPVQVALIRLDAAVSDLESKAIDNGWLLRWHEAGPGRNRELVLLSLLCPWQPKRIPLENFQSWALLEAVVVPWAGPFFVWVEVATTDNLFDSMQRGIIEPDGEAILLKSRLSGSYTPIDSFSSMFYNCVSGARTAEEWCDALEELQMRSMTSGHIKKLADALLLLRRHRAELEQYYSVQVIEEGLLLCIDSLTTMLGWQQVIEALFLDDATPDEFRSIACRVGLDFPSVNAKCVLSQQAWEYVLKLDVQMALLFAFCDRSQDRIMVFFFNVIQSNSLSDKDVWKSANADLVFNKRDRVQIQNEIARALGIAPRCINICGASEMLGYFAQFLKYCAEHKTQPENRETIREWMFNLNCEYQKTWICKLFSTMRF